MENKKPEERELKHWIISNNTLDMLSGEATAGVTSVSNGLKNSERKYDYVHTIDYPEIFDLEYEKQLEFLKAKWIEQFLNP